MLFYHHAVEVTVHQRRRTTAANLDITGRVSYVT
jgi:hypothetical protein